MDVNRPEEEFVREISVALSANGEGGLSDDMLSYDIYTIPYMNGYILITSV